jgi:HlyD family secretion protein
MKLPMALALAVLLFGCGADVELAGTVERKVLELATPISEVITDLPLAEGERVEAGQIVVQLDTEVAAAELRASEAANAAAAAALVEAEGEFKRQEQLRRSKVTSPQALDAARRKRDEALAQVAEREARIAQARKRLENLTIRSLAAGVVDQLPYEVGERAPAGGVVAVVTADAKPWVRIWLPARTVARLGSGSGATVTVEGLDQPLRGTVTHISREPEFTPHYALTERESAHLVYESRVRLDDAPDDLRAGLPARVRLELDRSDP